VSLEIKLRHSFPGFSLDVEFQAPASGVTALFGPSGAGKSTIMSSIAGLLHADYERIVLNGITLADRDVHLPAERRRIGIVFQDGRLFPHLNVAANLRYGLRRAPAGPVMFDDVVDLLGIESLLGRLPRDLSGGERGRVAIGRALLSQPQLVLMDEPLVSLDRARRLDILPYLARLKSRLDVPILYVTHELEEVVRLADTLVLLEAGHIIATGPTGPVLARADLPLAHRDDTAAILQGTVVRHDVARRLTSVEAAGRTILLSQCDAGVGTPIRLRIPAREVAIATQAPQAISFQNCISAKVGALVEENTAHAVVIELILDGATLLARITPDAVERLALHPGATVLALFKATSVEPVA